MIFLMLVLSVLTWAAWIGLTVWIGPHVGEFIHPWLERTGDPQAHNAAVWVGSALVALFTGVVLMGAWAAF